MRHSAELENGQLEQLEPFSTTQLAFEKANVWSVGTKRSEEPKRSLSA